jgi:hypothetical protein
VIKDAGHLLWLEQPQASLASYFDLKNPGRGL